MHILCIKVLLTHRVSPACHLVKRVKRGADVTTTVASVVSGRIAVGAMVPAITVAPVLVAGAVLASTGAGLYAIFRSSFVLQDRRIHAQSISLANTEARNSYFNIVTGAMGVVTTGATKVASVAINRGAVVTETAATALLSVNVANLAVNGCNAANSAYSVISDLVQKTNPYALDIMHLTTTVLFSGNAVIIFKSAHAIYKQSQTLAEMIQSQKDNLWQRAKRVFFDKEFYLSWLVPVLPDRQMPLVKSTETMIQTLIDLQPTISFGYMLINNRDNVYAVLRIILSQFDFTIQEKLLKLVNWLIGRVISDAYKDLKLLFPHSELFVVFTNYVISFFKFNVTALEIEYQSKRAAAKADLQLNDAEYDRVCAGFSTNWERTTYFFQICVLKMFNNRGNIEELVCREMVRFFWDWLNDQMQKYLEQREKKANNCVRESFV